MNDLKFLTSNQSNIIATRLSKSSYINAGYCHTFFEWPGINPDRIKIEDLNDCCYNGPL